jgi:propionyl-CoA carboxylase alpha chain
VDTGVRAGSVVSSNYDSLLAKVIAHAPARVVAAAALSRSLRASSIAGVQTNVRALAAILDEPDYLAARTFTAYLDEHPEVLTAGGPEGDDGIALLLGAVFATEQRERKSNCHTGFAPSGWRNLHTRGQRQQWASVGDGNARTEWVEYTLHGNSATVLLGDPPTPDESGALTPDTRARRRVRLLNRDTEHQVIELDGCRRAVHVMLDDDAAFTSSVAGSIAWQQVPRFVDHAATEAAGGPRCPLPGTVVAVHVAAGDTVEEGVCLMVVEAMKMEHKIIASFTAVVEEVRFAVGDRVDEGDLLIQLG